MQKILFILVLIFACTQLHSEEANNPIEKVIFLSSPRSGVNLITCSLLVITRKPIGNFDTGQIFVNPSNRVDIEPNTQLPFIYRTHDVTLLQQTSSVINKLVFVTRNPKELLFRKFPNITLDDLNSSLVTDFIEAYLERFRLYESWTDTNRKIVFYEDFIVHDDETLLELLAFMKEEPIFYSDYIQNKQHYLKMILDSYKNQHAGSGTSVEKDKPKATHHSKNADPALLQKIDQILQKEPEIWNKYLQRFQTIN